MMCDFYLLLVRDMDNKVIDEAQFGPDSDFGVPEEEVCTCGMWNEDTATRRAFLKLVDQHLSSMPYGTLVIEKLP